MGIDLWVTAMNVKGSTKSNDSMFQKELETVARIETVQGKTAILPEELLTEYHFLSKMYLKMLKEMKKITRIGDMNSKKLLAANEQIQKQKNELEILNSQLVEANATQDKLYSIIAHDLRNPLQFLLFSSDVLYSDYESMAEEMVRSYVGKIFRTVQNMSDLLENLLQWSMSQYGTLECRPRLIHLNELISDVSNLFFEDAEKKNIQLIVAVGEDISAYADEDMIKSVLRNLLSNALKFTSKMGHVRVSTRQQGEVAIVSVMDSGVGVPREKLALLFKIGLNKSTPGTAKEKGTGLGLILCKELVEKNGGEIFVSSEEGSGSCFEFSIPLARV